MRQVLVPVLVQTGQQGSGDEDDLGHTLHKQHPTWILVSRFKKTANPPRFLTNVTAVFQFVIFTTILQTYIQKISSEMNLKWMSQ